MKPARRLGQVLRLTWRERADLGIAVWELALANRRLAGRTAAQAAKAGLRPVENGDVATDMTMVARVAWAIPRAAAVVPWRADCLRQAEAARRWLSRLGIASEVRLGARKGPDNRVDAHAWLICNTEVVTGGDISAFVPFR